jgi:hypothetical protein
LVGLRIGLQRLTVKDEVRAEVHKRCTELCGDIRKVPNRIRIRVQRVKRSFFRLVDGVPGGTIDDRVWADFGGQLPEVARVAHVNLLEIGANDATFPVERLDELASQLPVGAENKRYIHWL